MNHRSRHRSATMLVVAALLAGADATTALGHSEVTSSSPAQGAEVKRFPTRMTVSFDDPIGRLGVMTVTRNGAGNLVKSARIAPTNARTALITLKRPGPTKRAGLYRLTWRVTGPDGHAVSGVIVFRVRPS